jgi:tetratricopeptide (TPR) repeat protein
MSKEEAAKEEALKKIFAEGVEASRAGKYDDAIAKFQEALKTTPDCFDCYNNIGFAYAEKKDYANAEAAFKKALELKPDYAQAYLGLANLYNAQRRFDEAKAASQQASMYAGTGEAGGASNADALYNQGIIMWNAGQIAEARKQFEQVVGMKPEHADAHYWLGMANLNEGRLPEATAEFETYLKLDPTGQHADEATKTLGLIKK